MSVYKQIKNEVEELEALRCDYKNLTGSEWVGVNYRLWEKMYRSLLCILMVAHVGTMTMWVIQKAGIYHFAFLASPALEVALFWEWLVICEAIFLCCQLSGKKSTACKNVAIRHYRPEIVELVKAESDKLAPIVGELRSKRAAETKANLQVVRRILEKDFPNLELKIGERLTGGKVCSGCVRVNRCSKGAGCLELFDRTADSCMPQKRFLDNEEGYEQLIRYLASRHDYSATLKEYQNEFSQLTER